MINQRSFFKLSALFIVGLLVACVPLPNEITPTVTKAVVDEVSTQTSIIQSTVEPTKTATPEVTATSKFKYTEAQEAVLLKPEVQERLAKLGNAVEAWKVAGGSLDGKNVEIVPVFDNNDNPSDATYVIEFKDIVNTYYYTSKNGDLNALPEDGIFTVKVPERGVLSCVEGMYAVRDSNGELVKVMNVETGNWVMDKEWVKEKFLAGEWPLESDKLIYGATGKSVDLGFMHRGKVELVEDSFDNVSLVGLMIDVVEENGSTYMMVGVTHNGERLVIPVQVVVGGTKYLNRLAVGYVSNTRSMTTNLGSFDELVGQDILVAMNDSVGDVIVVSLNLNEFINWGNYGLPDDVVKEMVEIHNPLTQQNASLVNDLSKVGMNSPLYSIQVYIYQ